MRRETVLALVMMFGLGGMMTAGAHVPPPAKGEGLAQSLASVQTALRKAQTATNEEAARRLFTDLELVTQDGKRVRFYTDVLKDKVVLINFFYTQCPSACPLLTNKLTRVRAKLEGQIGNHIGFVSITLDPERDTPAALKRFAQRQHAADHEGWVFLTGKSKNVNHIVKTLGHDSSDLQSHSSLMLAGNVRSAQWIMIPPMMPSAGIVDRLRMLAEER